MATKKQMKKIEKAIKLLKEAEVLNVTHEYDVIHRENFDGIVVEHFLNHKITFQTH